MCFCYNYNPEDNPERNKCYIKVNHCAVYEPTNGKYTECASTYTLVTVGETATQKYILTGNIGKHCNKIDPADKCIGYEGKDEYTLYLTKDENTDNKKCYPTNIEHCDTYNPVNRKYHVYEGSYSLHNEKCYSSISVILCSQQNSNYDACYKFTYAFN